MDRRKLLTPIATVKTARRRPANHINTRSLAGFARKLCNRNNFKCQYDDWFDTQGSPQGKLRGVIALLCFLT